MRIVMLSHNVAESRGTYFRVVNLGSGMAALGHQVTVLATSAGNRVRIHRRTAEGISIIEFPALLPGAVRSGWDPLDVCWRWAAAASGRLGPVDIVHAFDCRPTVILPAIRLAKSSGAKLIIDWADWWGRGGTIEERPAGRRVRSLVRPLETWFEESFRTRADYSTVVSEALRDRAISLGVPSDRITLLPSGGNSCGIRPQPLEAAREAVGLDREGEIVGHLGSMLDTDAHLLASAYAELRRRRPGLRMLLIGDIAGNIPHIEGMIRTGPVPFAELPQYLASCEVFLLPLADTIANRGRWPGKINLYMAAGRPTVATPVGDLRRLFTEMGGGVLADLNAGAFISAVESLLDDPPRRQLIGDVARRLAVERFDWRVLARQLREIYVQTLERG